MMENTKKDAVQRATSILVTILLIMAVLICLYTVVQVLSNGYVNICGYMMFRVVTGSMEPTIDVGALLLTREIDITDVKVNDIVCFQTQESAIFGEIVTHRVVNRINMADGGVLLETKGDANPVSDGYYVAKDNFLGKVVWYTGDDSMLASIFAFFTNKVGFLAVIVFPCLLIVSFILKDCVKNIRSELEVVKGELDKSGNEDWKTDPMCGMSNEEYVQMCDRIRKELLEELTHSAEVYKEASDEENSVEQSSEEDGE